MIGRYLLLVMLFNTILCSLDLEYSNKYLDKDKSKGISAYVMIRYQSLKLESKQKSSSLKEVNNLLILLSNTKYQDKKKLLELIKNSENAVELLDSIHKEFKNYI